MGVQGGADNDPYQLSEDRFHGRSKVIKRSIVSNRQNRYPLPDDSFPCQNTGRIAHNEPIARQPTGRQAPPGFQRVATLSLHIYILTDWPCQMPGSIWINGPPPFLDTIFCIPRLFLYAMHLLALTIAKICTLPDGTPCVTQKTIICFSCLHIYHQKYYIILIHISPAFPYNTRL